MNSVSNPAVTSAHHAKKHANSALSGPPAGDGGEFGDLFANILAGAEGQELAAPTGKASPPAEGLASQILGPSVHIITSETPVMSDDSLYAFARSQGMDESALALIFQREAPPLAELAAVTTNASPADAVGSDPSAIDATTPVAGADLSSQANAADAATDALMLAQQRLALQKSSDANAQPGTDADGMSTLDLGAEAKIRWSVDQAQNQPGSQPGQPQADAKATAKLEQAAEQIKAAKDNVVTMATVQHDKHDAPTRDVAAMLMMGEAEAMEFAKRVQAKQANLRAERLGSVSGDAFKSAALGANLSPDANARDAATPLEALDLGTELTGEDLRMIWEHRQASAGHASDNSSQGSGQANGPQSDIDLRALQYEKLSQRLSEALGQRLAAQIARGDWKVELALKPQDLGSIEIKLNMKQGTLEASFDAAETMTRHLIIDGLQQLKESLAQSGMEVAEVNVNVRQDSQNGGNSTPGRQKSPGDISGVSKGGPAKTQLTTTDSLATRKPAADNDGLDLLV